MRILEIEKRLPLREAHERVFMVIHVLIAFRCSVMVANEGIEVLYPSISPAKLPSHTTAQNTGGFAGKSILLPRATRKEGGRTWGDLWYYSGYGRLFNGN